MDDQLLDEDLQRTMRTVSSIRHAYMSSSIQINDLKDNNNHLRSELERARSDTTDLRSRAIRLVNVINHLKDGTSALEKVVEARNAEIEQLKQRFENVSKAEKTQQSFIDKYEQKIEDIKKDCDNKIEGCKKDMELKVQEYALELEVIKATNSAEISELTTKLEKVQETENRKAAQLVLDYEEKLREAAERQESIKRELLVARTGFNTNATMYQRKIKELESIIKNFEDKNKNFDDSDKKVMELENKVKKYEEMISGMTTPAPSDQQIAIEFGVGTAKQERLSYLSDNIRLTKRRKLYTPTNYF